MEKYYTCLSMVMMLVALPATFCQATPASGDNRLHCTLEKLVECNRSAECAELAAEDLGLPDSLIIDLQTKKIMEATSVVLRKGSFTVNTTSEGMTILSGIDGLRSWSAVLSANHTRLSASVSDESTGFVVFGTCRAD
jgi:hypothetical protein